jgi:hypothetical protein
MRRLHFVQYLSPSPSPSPSLTEAEANGGLHTRLLAVVFQINGFSLSPVDLCVWPGKGQRGSPYA